MPQFYPEDRAGEEKKKEIKKKDRGSEGQQRPLPMEKKNQWSYFKTLKAPNIHHVITALGNHTHHLHSFLQYNVTVRSVKTLNTALNTIRLLHIITFRKLELHHITSRSDVSNPAFL